MDTQSKGRRTNFHRIAAFTGVTLAVGSGCGSRIGDTGNTVFERRGNVDRDAEVSASHDAWAGASTADGTGVEADSGTAAQMDAGGAAVGQGALGDGGSQPGAWRARGGFPGCDTRVAPTSQIRPLTNAQYDRTVQELLGISLLTKPAGLRPSQLLDPSEPLSMTSAAWDAYQAAASEIATQVIADSTLRSRFVSCDLAQADACLRQTIPTFGRRAFRRPLTEPEVASFERVISASESATPEIVAEALLKTFLISPGFLYRQELSEVPIEDGVYSLSSHELATRLSYLLWGSMPDETLAAKADAGQLQTSQDVLEQAQRMLVDHRARSGIAAIHRTYLQMNPNSLWTVIQKDVDVFPEFEPSLVSALLGETERFFDEVVFSGAGFGQLFLSPKAFVNQGTAPLYGLDGAKFGTELVEVNLPSRPGFLTRLGFLATHSLSTRTSPIRRGAFIARRVVGMDLPIPPPDAAQTPLPVDESILTNRRATGLLTASLECAVCHEPLINPFGFALEAYDAMGKEQTTDALGGPIDTAATLLLDDAVVEVATPADLMAAIAGSDAARTTYVKAWLGHALGRRSDETDDCVISELSDRLQQADYRILDMIVDLTLAPQIAFRTVETSP